MTLLRWPMFLLISFIFLTGCKQKKKVSLSGEDPVEVSDFIAFFPTVNLPYTFSDSLLQRKEKDSLQVSYKIFTQFVPDSMISKIFGKEKKLKIYPVGKSEDSKNGTYLFTKIISATKRAAFIIAMDKKDAYMTAMPVLRSDQGKTTQRTTLIDKKFTITQTQVRKNTDGSSSEGKDIYVLNPETREFNLIMTDALDDKVTELINPIDTAARKHKWSADYTAGKMNLVSIRDGRKTDRLSFFIHFEKSNSECTGELKGEAMIKSTSLAEYRLGGDPCVLQFRFTASSVTLKEIEGCGAHRELRCSFDGTFVRKKIPKQKITKPKSSARK